MPPISSFYGITIWMYYDEVHHLELDVLVVEWATVHRAELRDNWARARRHQQLEPIEPLS